MTAARVHEQFSSSAAMITPLLDEGLPNPPVVISRGPVTRRSTQHLYTARADSIAPPLWWTSPRDAFSPWSATPSLVSTTGHRGPFWRRDACCPSPALTSLQSHGDDDDDDDAVSNLHMLANPHVTIVASRRNSRRASLSPHFSAHLSGVLRPRPY